MSSVVNQKPKIINKINLLKEKFEHQSNNIVGDVHYAVREEHVDHEEGLGPDPETPENSSRKTILGNLNQNQFSVSYDDWTEGIEHEDTPIHTDEPDEP